MRFCRFSFTPDARGLHRSITTAVVLLAACICGATAAGESPRTMTITVPANSADGYVLEGPFKAGTKLAIHYVSGKWAAWPGDMEEISPDNPSRISCQAILAERSKPDGPISVLDMVAGGTSTLAREYQLDHDVREILIRMNGKNGYFAKNTGSVLYTLTITSEK